MKSNKFWLGLLLLLVLAACAAGLYFAGGGTEAVITRDGVELYRIDLSRVDELYTLEIDGDYRNTVEVDRGRIRVSHADCPDQVCVDTGWIEDGTVPIVCLPNKLVIEIKESGTADVAVK